jgi:hypothetical protein
MKEFSHKDEWRMSGADFLVTVTRHSVNILPEYNYDNLGPNRWAVYAYIYPTHKLFTKFNGSDIFQDATSELPLHGGPSFLKFNYDSTGVKQSVQVGADYNHLWDDIFSHYKTKNDAPEVFVDAIKLFEYLSK